MPVEIVDGFEVKKTKGFNEDGKWERREEILIKVPQPKNKKKVLEELIVVKN